MSPTELNPGVKRQYFPAKPNPMFSPLITACVRFARYETAVPCACCGRRSKHHWTCIVRFKAADVKDQFLVLKFPRRWHPCGAPVCRNHILNADKKAMMKLYEEAVRKGNK